jgi:hypothetical protein
LTKNGDRYQLTRKGVRHLAAEGPRTWASSLNSYCELHTRKERLGPQPLIASGVMQMVNLLLQKDIEQRAYQLWQQAGMPPGETKSFTWKQSDS